MKVSTEELGACQVALNIEVESEEMEQSLQETYRRLVHRLNIPGFRKGKAPRPILERYIGEEGLRQEALESLVPKLCSQAIEEQKIEAIAQPQVEIIQTDPLVLKATLSLPPQVELGDYHNVRLSPEEVEITEEQIDNMIEHLRDQHALWEPVERPVEFGDLVTADIEGKNERSPTESYLSQQFLVNPDSSLLLPGFVEQLLGVEKGQEKDVILSYPDDYKREELRGQRFQFKVSLKEIKEKHLPELDDEFARSIGEGLDSLDALRQRVTTNLKNLAEERARKEFEERVTQTVVDLAKVEFPPFFVEQEIDRIINERGRWFGGGRAGVENYIKSVGKTEDEAREEPRDLAAKRVARGLVLDKIAEEEKIEVSVAEVDSEIEQMVKDSDNAEELRKMFDTPEGRRWVEQGLLRQKTVQHLVEVMSSVNEEKGGKDESA